MGQEDKIKPEEYAHKTDSEGNNEADQEMVQKPPEEKTLQQQQEQEQEQESEAIIIEPTLQQQPLPQPQEIVLKVFMHCEGCARKVRRCLKGFQGVESVETNCKNQIVVVKGEKADPLKVLARIQRKSHREVHLISPIPPHLQPPLEQKPQQIEKPKSEEKKQEVVFFSQYSSWMHCEACAEEIKRRMLKMKGVEWVEADLKKSEVRVKGAVEGGEVVEYVYRRTGKHAVIVKQQKEQENKELIVQEITKEQEAEAAEACESEKKIEQDKGSDAEAISEVQVENYENIEMKKNEYNYHNYPQSHSYITEMYSYPPQVVVGVDQGYAPQMFSDDNPNACSLI